MSYKVNFNIDDKKVKIYKIKMSIEKKLKTKSVFLLDALHFKSNISVCKYSGNLLKTFAPWIANVLRPVSVLTLGTTMFLFILRVFTL